MGVEEELNQPSVEEDFLCNYVQSDPAQCPRSKDGCGV